MSCPRRKIDRPAGCSDQVRVDGPRAECLSPLCIPEQPDPDGMQALLRIDRATGSKADVSRRRIDRFGRCPVTVSALFPERRIPFPINCGSRRFIHLRLPAQSPFRKHSPGIREKPVSLCHNVRNSIIRKLKPHHEESTYGSVFLTGLSFALLSFFPSVGLRNSEGLRSKERLPACG